MIKTKVKVFLKDTEGNKDTLVTWVNLPEQEAHDRYIGKWINVGIRKEHLMKCYKVETLDVKEVVRTKKLNASLSV